MKSLRRYHQSGTHYFITAVTFNRRPILLDVPPFFPDSWGERQPLAWILIPDHIHAILDIGDSDRSVIMHKFKITYSRRYRDKFGPGRVWQNRFWDHSIRDQSDFNRHLDYIHYNSVKHGLAHDPFEYPHSSLKEYLARGMYERNWGVVEPPEFLGEFGE